MTSLRSPSSGNRLHPGPRARLGSSAEPESGSAADGPGVPRLAPDVWLRERGGCQHAAHSGAFTLASSLRGCHHPAVEGWVCRR